MLGKNPMTENTTVCLDGLNEKGVLTSSIYIITCTLPN